MWLVIRILAHGMTVPIFHRSKEVPSLKNNLVPNNLFVDFQTNSLGGEI